MQLHGDSEQPSFRFRRLLLEFPRVDGKKRSAVWLNGGKHASASGDTIYSEAWRKLQQVRGISEWW